MDVEFKYYLLAVVVAFAYVYAIWDIAKTAKTIQWI